MKPREGNELIYVNPSQVTHIEYLIQQSIRGNHVLFDADLLRAAYRWDQTPTEEQAYSMEPHLERLIHIPELAQKRAYLEQLDSPTLELLVKTYFSIVENNLYESAEMRH